MGIALLITFIFVAFVWLVFFRFKWLKFSMTWGIVTFFIALHVFLIFVIGLRFVTPYSTNLKVVQHTVQLIPRLPEPTLLTAVLVKPDVPIKKGQPLFQFDRRPYEYQFHQLEAQLEANAASITTAQYKIKQLEAELAAARQDVRMMQTDVVSASQKVVRAQSELTFAKYKHQLLEGLAAQKATPEEEVHQWDARMHEAQAAVTETSADAERARLRYDANIGGVNTVVAKTTAELEQSKATLKQALATAESTKAQLELAQYYLDNTTMVAPEDGHIVNLQVQPGMVVGLLRVGGIAAFIVDSDRYMLASFSQETLKYVKIGQPAEVALDLYPGQIFQARVDTIWWANGEGQYLPSDEIPKFHPPDPNFPQFEFAVKLYLDHPSKVGLPIGAQGAAAIYTNSGGWAALRKIAIRSHTWINWLYPIPF
jgi:multidrug resistance efflux pump